MGDLIRRSAHCSGCAVTGGGEGRRRKKRGSPFQEHELTSPKKRPRDRQTLYGSPTTEGAAAAAAAARTRSSLERYIGKPSRPVPVCRRAPRFQALLRAHLHVAPPPQPGSRLPDSLIFDAAPVAHKSAGNMSSWGLYESSRPPGAHANHFIQFPRLSSERL